MWRIGSHIPGMLGAARVLLLLLFASPPSAAAAQQVDERRSFLYQMSQHFFGASGPENALEGGKKGWAVLMLAPPGTSLVALTEGYNGVTADLSRAWSNLSVFDRPVDYRNGYAVLGPRGISAIWDETLAEMMPPLIAPKVKMSRSAAERWLYACSKQPPRRPSKQMLEYRKFEDLIRLLISGRDSDLWRLHPELKRFTSYESALNAVNRRWIQYGYKDQIEAAIKVLDTEQNTAAWRKWLMMRNAYDVNRTPVDVVRSMPQTIMLPQPGTWAESTIWSRASVTTSGGQRYNFHVGRVKIIRPWLDLDTMLDSSEAFNAVPSRDRLALSDGTAPTEATFPTGTLPAVVDELILVKQVRIEGAGASLGDHPLGMFAYPEAVNLVGYIVRTLPKTPF